MGIEQFLLLVERVWGRHLDPQQRACVEATPLDPLLIVAGPGSGKTTVLVFRALRLVLVEHILPEQIMITTFTKKAAREIRSRLISWGTPLVDEAILASDDAEAEFLRLIDVNRFITGTLDAIAQEAISSDRGPTERPPIVLESFVANVLLTRRGEVYEAKENPANGLGEYLARYAFGGRIANRVGDYTKIIRSLADRFIHDEVDVARYRQQRGNGRRARQTVTEIIDKYENDLRATNRLDFPRLERALFQRIRDGQTPEMLANVRALLVDEYQDTNALQEGIYFSLTQALGATLTAVGDDDQSLYRFRGATIELFRHFRDRIATVLPNTHPTVLPLTENYRSSPEIVDFVNAFIHNDLNFQPARVVPPKPRIHANKHDNAIPILGLFSPDAETLARRVSSVLHDIFRGDGFDANGHLPERIQRDPDVGDLGDAVLLAHTVEEFSSAQYGRATPRFTSHLRAEMAARGMAVFNPRGRALSDIADVGLILGLALESLDPSNAAAPEGPIVNQMRLRNDTRTVFRAWRSLAQDAIALNPVAQRGQRLRDRVDSWRRFAPVGEETEADWPFLDVLYMFLPWFERFQDDPEHQVYLEAISRAGAAAGTFSPYRGMLVYDLEHRTRSIQAAIRDILLPVAEGLVEIDEEIMPSVPRTLLNIMTIHQAKGLEFPLVIVDVSSAFKINSAVQRFRRFPDAPSSVTQMEDDLAPFTPIGPLRVERTSMDRTFEDLIRLYYVAYSRPQSALMLVGCDPCLRYDSPIRHVATYWRQDGSWPWQVPFDGDKPARANNIPLFLV